MLATGAGLRRDDAQAAQWGEKAARQGDPEGMAVRGLILLQGRGVGADPATAIGFIERAARRGDVTAQCAMATLHMRGAPMPRDTVRDMMWILLPRLVVRSLPDENERRGLMLEPPERTLHAVELVSSPASHLAALTLATQLCKDLADSGEWPLVDPVPAVVPLQN